MAAAATLAEWLSGCGSCSGRVAEWLLRFREPCCTSPQKNKNGLKTGLKKEKAWENQKQDDSKKIKNRFKKNQKKNPKSQTKIKTAAKCKKSTTCSEMEQNEANLLIFLVFFLVFLFFAPSLLRFAAYCCRF